MRPFSLLFLFLSCSSLFAQDTIPVSIAWEIDGPDQPRSTASHVLELNSRLLIGTGGKRVLEYDLQGDLVGTLIDMGGVDTGPFNQVSFSSDGNLLAHGAEPGYNIFNAIFDPAGTQLFYANVTNGQSGTGALIESGEDLVMAWASNCCGTGQTWDTELKRFNGQSASIQWNTDLCYECNNWAGSCHHGQDYPMALFDINDEFIVFKANVTSPCYAQIAMQRVTHSGQVTFDIILDGNRNYLKAIPTVGGFILTGNFGAKPNRVPFVSFLNSDGTESWSTTVDDQVDAIPADLIELQNGHFLFSIIEGQQFHFLELNISGDLISESWMPVSNAVQDPSNSQRLGNQLKELSPGDFIMAYNHGAWYDDTRFSLIRFNRSGSPGCTDASACNYDDTANFDDNSCIPSGCMEEGACNYNASAECEGEACDYGCCPGPGCCGDGMHWDAGAQTCIITPPSVASDAECTLLNLQELAEGYQLLLAENAELDSLLADCNGTASETGSNGCADENAVTFDGHDYELVEIGDQCWFAENLQTERYANGDLLEGDLSDGEWSSTTSGAQAVRNNDDSNLPSRGRLYNWFAVVDTRGLCPSGWHVPTDTEWMALELQLGMPQSEVEADGSRGTDEGQTLKSSASDSPPWNGNNSTGFSAFPGGKRSDGGTYSYGTTDCFIWTKSTLDGNSAWLRDLDGDSHIERYAYPYRNGFSVRCVKD